ncbi:unnamed protein product, partial [Ceratitis capitata]
MNENSTEEDIHSVGKTKVESGYLKISYDENNSASVSTRPSSLSEDYNDYIADMTYAPCSPNGTSYSIDS